MEQSSATHAAPIVNAAEPKLGRGDTVQAVISGAVFGALGAVCGNWLGSKGGNHGPRMMGKKFMTWFGGLSVGVVAMYVSLKTSSQLAQQASVSNEETVVIKKPLMDAKPEMALHDAAPQLQAAQVAHEGRIQPLGQALERV